jgi:hypothetical protein
VVRRLPSGDKNGEKKEIGLIKLIDSSHESVVSGVEVK